MCVCASEIKADVVLSFNVSGCGAVVVKGS